MQRKDKSMKPCVPQPKYSSRINLAIVISLIFVSIAQPLTAFANTSPTLYIVSSDIQVSDLIKNNNLDLDAFNKINNTTYKKSDRLVAGQSVFINSGTPLDNSNHKSFLFIKPFNSDALSLPDLSNSNHSKLSNQTSFTSMINASEPTEATIAESIQYVAQNGIEPRNLLKSELTNQKQQQLSNLNNKLNSNIESALDFLGRARINFSVDENANLTLSEASLFSQLYNQETGLLFSQFTLSSTDEENEKRTFLNSGLGYRYIDDTYLMGLNAFYDHDLSASHSRLGVGAEYWRDNFKLSSNYYFPLSTWKNAYTLEEYLERPARGFDVKAIGYLPTYPQLGGSLAYEKYFGDEVALFGLKERQNNPDSFTAGVNYSPIPLLTLDVSNKFGESNQNDFKIGLQMNFDFQQTVNEQLNPDAIVQTRSLMGSKYDFVERNNQIIYEYKQNKFNVAIAASNPKATYSIKELINLTSTHTSPSEIVSYSWVITPSAKLEKNTPNALSFRAESIGTYSAYLVLKNKNGITAQSNTIQIIVEDEENLTYLSLNYVDRHSATSLANANSQQPLEANQAYRRYDNGVLNDLPVSVTQIHLTVSAFQGEFPFAITTQPRLSHYVNKAWQLVDLSSPYLEIVDHYQDEQNPHIWHFIVTSKQDTPDTLKIKTEINVPNSLPVESELYFKTQDINDQNNLDGNYRITLTERGRRGDSSHGEIVFDTANSETTDYQMKQDMYYEVAVYEKAGTSAWVDITAQVQDSITWKYWSPEQPGLINPKINVQNNQYYGLEACQGHVLFSTQVNNFVNNELSWGAISDNMISLKQNTPSMTLLNEQNLQLAVQFDTESRDRSKSELDRTLCDDKIRADSKYVDLMWELANMKPNVMRSL